MPARARGGAGMSVASQEFPRKYEDPVVGFHSVARLLGNTWQTWLRQ